MDRFPNAMYGSWEAAINASQTNATEQQQSDFKDQVLERIAQGSSSDLTSR
jgi:predicted secreted acid phosphatase